MADHEQENAREHLTEREREALRILAREIVREAVAQEQTPEQKRNEEAWVEGEKLLHETAKTQALITAGLLGASGAAWFIPDPKDVGLLVWAVVLGIGSLGLALGHMSFISNDVRVPSDLGTFPRWPRNIVDLLSTVNFIAATALLSLYISNNT